MESSSGSPFVTGGDHSRKYILDQEKPTVEFVGGATNISQKVTYNNKEYIVTVTVPGQLDEAGVQSALNDALVKTKTLAKAFKLGSDESHITAFTIQGNGDLSIEKDAKLLTGDDAKAEALNYFKSEKAFYKNKITTKPGTEEKQRKRQEKINNLKQIKDLITKVHKPENDHTAQAEVAVRPAVSNPPAAVKGPKKKKEDSIFSKDQVLQELAKKEGEEFNLEFTEIRNRAVDKYKDLVKKHTLTPNENIQKAALEEKILYLDDLKARKNNVKPLE